MRSPILALVLSVALMALAASVHAFQEPDEELSRLRAERRALSRDHLASKSGASSFGLLVIPVDFADARLPDSWDPGQEMDAALNDPDNPSLSHYFNMASAGQLQLEITLAPLVSLAGNRADYSDVGWNGFSRTRKLARESIQSVVDLGLELRRLDLQGPDGQVDGVLILHGATGQENDPDSGLIQALQFFLEEPIEDGGVQASFYAVASLHSGLGIWAHETGHLLGMNDRYDPLLHPETGGADVRSLGGLGRFSLMSSGAWGTGEGMAPALPDAYTSIQMGWTEAVNVPTSPGQEISISPWRAGGSVYRAWRAGVEGPEYFLLESRNPVVTAPYDAEVPAHQMLITHVDETVPEAWYSEGGPLGYHLRVHLVEADAQTGLAEGLDDGRPEDLFPGPGEVTSFGPTTLPSSQGYDGPSQVRVENIRSESGAVLCTVTSSEGPVVQLRGEIMLDGGQAYLMLRARSLGSPVSALGATVTIAGDGGGQFPGGGTVESFNLLAPDDSWSLVGNVQILAPGVVQPGLETLLRVELEADGQDLEPKDFHFVWAAVDDALAFHLPGWEMWEEVFPSGSSMNRWHLWEGPPYLTDDLGPVLVCVDEDYDSPSAWPSVRYWNNGWNALVSPPLPYDSGALRLTHAIELEYLHSGTVMDGATVWWQGPDGQKIQAEPIGGHDAVISPRSNNPQGGIPALGDSLMTLDLNSRPDWRVDLFEFPQEVGPWRLRLEFSSNGAYAGKGWFIARMDHVQGVPGYHFDLRWDTSGAHCSPALAWVLPAELGPHGDSRVEVFDETSRQFLALESLDPEYNECHPGYVVSADRLLAALPGGGNGRFALRVKADGGPGTLVSNTVYVYPDGGAPAVGLLEAPFPNPSSGFVKFLVETPAGTPCRVVVYDLRGRLIRTFAHDGGRRQLVWDGLDKSGRRVAAGTYYLRLEGSGLLEKRKVVLLR